MKIKSSIGIRKQMGFDRMNQTITFPRWIWKGRGVKIHCREKTNHGIIEIKDSLQFKNDFAFLNNKNISFAIIANFASPYQTRKCKIKAMCRVGQNFYLLTSHQEHLTFSRHTQAKITIEWVSSDTGSGCQWQKTKDETQGNVGEFHTF